MATSETSEGTSLSLVVLIGIPGSGKTYLAKQIENYLGKSQAKSGKKYRVVVVSYDSLIPLEQQAKFALEACEGEKWKEARKKVHACVERIVENLINKTISCGKISDANDLPSQLPFSVKLHQENIEGKGFGRSLCEALPDTKACSESKSTEPYKETYHHTDIEEPDAVTSLLQSCSDCDLKREYVLIILDDNMYYRSMRYEYYQLARKYSIGFCQFYLDCPVNVAVTCNRQRDNALPNEVIVNMFQKVEVPDPLKYSWEQFSFTLPMKEHIISLQLIHAVIDSTFLNPVPPMKDLTEKQQEAQAVCDANVIHQMDKILRKMVHSHMYQVQARGGMKKDEMSILSKHLNDTRQAVLEDIKCGTVVVSENIVQAVQEGKQGALIDLSNVVDEMFNLKLDSDIKIVC